MGPLELVLEPPKAGGSRDQSVLWQGRHSLLKQPSRTLDARTGRPALKQIGLQSWQVLQPFLCQTQTEGKALSQVWCPGKQTLRWGCPCKKCSKKGSVGEWRKLDLGSEGKIQGSHSKGSSAPRMPMRAAPKWSKGLGLPPTQETTLRCSYLLGKAALLTEEKLWRGSPAGQSAATTPL